MLLSKRHVEPRVLLIEDAEETRELSRLALESQACHVVGVSSAEAALGLLAAGERFDLLFTDVNLARSVALKPPTGSAACIPSCRSW